MPKRPLIKEEEKMYWLQEDETGSLFLEVVAGGVAMGIVSVPLNADEAQQYRGEGKPILDRLAQRIAYDPASFRERASYL